MDSGGDIELGMESTLNRMNNVLQAEAHSQLPPGFRFHPTDEELVCYYLTEKIRDSTFSCSAIAEANLNKCEPWDLPAKAKIGEIEWYFFNLRDRKYPKGLRTNRATEAGYWKTTGKDRQLFSSQSSALFGMKKTLVFYKGRAPNGEKTNWVMHEYRLQSKFSYHPLLKQCKDEWVVCRIFEKSAETNRRSIGRMSRNIFLDLPGSPSLPSLWESLCNTNSANDQKNRSSESGLGTSEKAHNVSCSILMEPNSNSKGQHLQQFECGSSLNYSDSSDQLSEMTRFMNQSSYMHDLMLNDPRIHMNAGSFFPVTNMRRDQISAILDQQLPGLLPARLCNTQMPLSSNSSNLGFSTDACLPALPCSNEVSKAPVGQSAGNLLKSFSSSCVIHYETLGKANNCVNRFQWSNDGLSQKIMAQPIQKADGATCSTEDMNDEMTSVDYNLLARSLDQLDSSATPPFHF